MGAMHYFRILNPIAMPPGNPVTVNLPVLCFTASLAVVTALLFGLIPALKGSRVDLMDALRASAQAATLSLTARTLRRVLVIAEVALSLALLASAGLLIESVERVASTPLGFRTDHLVTMSITLPKWAYSTNNQRARFYRAALDRAALVPDVVSAAFASSVPPDGRSGGYALAVGGRPEPNPAARDRSTLAHHCSRSRQRKGSEFFSSNELGGNSGSLPSHESKSAIPYFVGVFAPQPAVSRQRLRFKSKWRHSIRTWPLVMCKP
jgi:hypothetical protein